MEFGPWPHLWIFKFLIIILPSLYFFSALDACRYAIEMVEKSSAESTPSTTPFSTPHSTPTSGSATPSSIPPKKVGITHVMRVLSGVYENAAVATSSAAKTPNSGAASGSSGGGTLTLQQKIIICCLVLIHKKGKNTKIVTVGKLQEVYKKVSHFNCRSLDMPMHVDRLRQNPLHRTSVREIARESNRHS